jgi:PAS domain S-box-containing protein
VAGVFVSIKSSAFQDCIESSTGVGAGREGTPILSPEIHLPPNSATAVLDRNGTELARNPKPETYVGHKARSWPGIEKACTEPTIETTGLDGTVREYHYVTVEGSQDSIFVLFGQPKAAIIAASQAKFIDGLWQIALAAGATLCLAWIMAEISVLIPVKSLTGTAEKLTGGDLQARVLSRGGTRELIQLADAFNTMAESLQLQHEKMETRVLERTTELAASNQSLQASERTTRALLDTIPGLAVLLDETGIVLSSNQAMAAVLGRQPDDLPGQSLFSLLPQPLSDNHREQLSRACKSGRPVRYDEVSDGTTRDVIIQPLPETPEGKRRFAVLAIDVTKQRIFAERLRQAQKMEAIGQLAGGVAHDFNNILAAIILNLGLLKEDPSLTSQIRKGLDELEDGAKRAANMTRQLLLFSRRQIMQPRTFEFNRSLRELAPILRRLIEERVQLAFNYCAEDVWMEADPTMLDQLVINLCVNARDAMPDGGDVLIETAVIPRENASLSGESNLSASSFLRLSVKDTGQGMDDTVKKHLFEPFFTTKAVGKGTGLGLAAVDSIVKQHRGCITVESTPGKGTTFQVFLPALAKGAAIEPPSGRYPLPGGTEAILLVEDDEAVRAFTARALRGLGYRVREAASAQQARELWTNQSGSFDLLFTDMVIPLVRSGLELALQFRKERPRLRVLIGTGYSSETSPESLAQIGIDCILKPYEIGLLATTLRRSLDKPAGSFGVVVSHTS